MHKLINYISFLNISILQKETYMFLLQILQFRLYIKKFLKDLNFLLKRKVCNQILSHLYNKKKPINKGLQIYY